jgi:uncharacterized protein YndB with AHSA1/START domain
MRTEEAFVVDRPPELVFDYMTNPANLAAWQTSKTSVEQITDGPPGIGTRVRERTKAPGRKEFEQIVEFTQFDRPRRFRVHVVEGPVPVDGTWTLEPLANGTRVHFVAEGELSGPMRILQPLLQRMVSRQFAGYHRLLKSNIETD